MKFNDFKAKNKLLSRTPFTYFIYALPLLFSLTSYSCLDSFSPYLVVPTAGNVIGTLIAFSHAVNFGAAPFWSFALTYQLFFLDLILVLSLSYAMRNLKNHR